MSLWLKVSIKPSIAKSRGGLKPLFFFSLCLDNGEAFLYFVSYTPPHLYIPTWTWDTEWICFPMPSSPLSWTAFNFFTLPSVLQCGVLTAGSTEINNRERQYWVALLHFRSVCRHTRWRRGRGIPRVFSSKLKLVIYIQFFDLILSCSNKSTAAILPSLGTTISDFICRDNLIKKKGGVLELEIVWCPWCSSMSSGCNSKSL